MNKTLRSILFAGLALASLLTVHVMPQLASVLLLLFAGAIVGVLLDGLTRLLMRVLPVRHAIAFTLVLVAIVAAVAGLCVLIGPRVASEVPALVQRVPQAWHALLDQLNNYAPMQALVAKAEQPLAWLSQNANLSMLVSGTFGALTNMLVVAIVGIYSAATPQRYKDFSRHLLPTDMRRQGSRLARELAGELRHWMIGRLVSMSIVGVATGFGLWLVGVPLSFTLGLLAGLLSFVPYIGPILGLVPAVLMASVQSLAMAGWVLVVYALVQFVESTLLTPLIQQRAIALPAVALIAAQLIGGVLVGPLGILLAAPVVVVVAATARHYQSSAAGQRPEVNA